MRKIIIGMTLAALSMAAVACWQQEIDTLDMGDKRVSRHQVTDLTAVAGDEEVTLSWTLPDGWTPSGFLITYMNPDQTTTKLEAAASPVVIKDLVNDYNYTFNVQAVYGDAPSGVVSVGAKPVTTRIAISDLTVEEADKTLTFSWTKPADNLTGYKLGFYSEKQSASDAQTVTIGADKTTYKLTGLENDVNYFYSMVAVYPNGDSMPVSGKAMPMSGRAFFLSSDKAAIGQPVNFKFNTTDYPTATKVFWVFPGNIEKEGTDIDYAFASAGEQNVVLHATIDGKEKTWTITITVRQWVIHYNEAPQNGTNYSGYKGSCPVFSPDGKTVYNITFNKKTTLVALSVETGEVKWLFEDKDNENQGSYNMCTVNPVTGDIVYGTQTAGSFVCVTATGEKKWSYKGLGSMQSAAPAISKDGKTVFAVDATGKAVALNAATGDEIWSVALGNKGGGILVNGNEVLFGVQNTTKTLSFLNAATGAEIATLACTAAMTDIAGFGVSADKKFAYVPHTGGGVSKVDLENHTLVINTTPIGTNNMYEPVVGPNGNVFIGSKDGHMYLLTPELAIVKDIDSGNGTNAFNYSHPAVDTDGNFYITAGGQKNQNFIIAPDGSVKDQWQYEEADKQMGGNNYLDGVFYSAYIGATSANGYIIGQYVGGVRYGGHGWDICGSCAIN